jgi:peroxiredoxin Q/BCP
METLTTLATYQLHPAFPMLKTLVAVTVLVALAAAFLLSTTRADPLQPGADAPALVTRDQNNAELRLADAWKKGLVLVYFYPKADTPGCTKQACSLRDDWDKLKAKGVTVLGVSMDKPESQKAFQDKYKLPFPLIADPEGNVVKAFGVPTMRIGFPSRQSFLVRDGKIVWHQPKVNAGSHLEEVLKAIESLPPAQP